jgi:hypothetical protein
MGAWWYGTRSEFINENSESLSEKLNSVATDEGWSIEIAQKEEWRKSIQLLQEQAFDEPIELLRLALKSAELKTIHGVLLEYDFRRRGLRMDAVLLCGSHTIVIEFKRSKLGSGDRDQVVNYCINLCEFHRQTQDSIDQHAAKVVPVLVSREDSKQKSVYANLAKAYQDWPAIPKNIAQCYAPNLREILINIVSQLNKTPDIAVDTWNSSIFQPSSSIVDAALSLYGNHDVSAIKNHASQMETINNCTNEIKARILEKRTLGGKEIIFMSGAPGAGKTLVGLNLTFSKEFRDDAVFMTGNAPLVEVLQESLKRSYRSMNDHRVQKLSGYSKKGVAFVKSNTVFKIVKAHHFLKDKDKKNDYQIKSSDGNILVIDEAQRTYEEGRMVIDHKLEDHEANLITNQMQQTQTNPIIVVLVGQNQHINRGERGPVAWLEAAEKYNWSVSISDATLLLNDFHEVRDQWLVHPNRHRLEHGHLTDSIRYYRNTGIERWAHAILTMNKEQATNEASQLNDEAHQILITRNLEKAKEWVRRNRVGEERSGLICSGKAVRLAAEGLFANLKPSIAPWMLSPSEDIRSSNMLETVQNQFQIQGLELDYTILCWDADLRIENGAWTCYNISGGNWQKQKKAEALQERKNGYRVLLTRARKGMVIFVPKGDLSDPIRDETRSPEFYNSIFDFLVECGAKILD